MGSDAGAVLFDVPRGAASFLADVRRMDERVQLEARRDPELLRAWEEFYSRALAGVMRRCFPATPEGM